MGYGNYKGKIICQGPSGRGNRGDERFREKLPKEAWQSPVVTNLKKDRIKERKPFGRKFFGSKKEEPKEKSKK